MVIHLRHKNIFIAISTNSIGNKSLKKKVNKSILSTFTGFKKTTNNNISLSFVFTDNIGLFFNDKEYVNYKKIRCSSSQVHYKDHELNFLFDHKLPHKIVVNVKDNETLFSSLRIFNKAFKSNIDLQITTFYYRVFLLFVQLWNLENKCSFVHAASVKKGDEAILFSADSGLGKSSLMLQLSQKKEFEFLSDDLSIISAEGEVFFQGRGISIKPYHLKFFKFLELKVFSLMNFFQWLQWKILNDNRLVFRVNPKNIFSTVASKAKIMRVIHLCNSNSNEFRFEKITSNQLIKYVMPILFIKNLRIWMYRAP